MKYQSIRYSGSKEKIIPKIDSLLNESLAEASIHNVLDGFSGSTRTSQFFKQKGYAVTSNDMAIYSKVLAECYLLADKPKEHYQKIISHLNNLKPQYGWFSENYGGADNNGLSVQEDGLKRPFQFHVTEKIDSIREEIDCLFPEDCVDKSVLLTSLLLSLDKVCNDLGHHVSYLKEWSTRSYNQLRLEVPNYRRDTTQKHKVYCSDVLSLRNNEFDLCYFDPPYGTSNQVTKTTRVRYFSYYHLWTTVCKNDKPKLFGNSKRREDVSSDSLPGAISVFEDTKDPVVENAFNNLLNFNTKYSLFSYSNRSKVPIDKLLDLISAKAEIQKVLKFEHAPNSQTFALTNGNWKSLHDEPNYEYLILAKTK